jgi:DNA mismatch repair protein MutL
MPRIALLPEELTNQIAAGEVVERPASVVKELVENSLDAGAARIDVDIEEGGLSLVRIADDGCGMTPEDAELSLLRHATSKLRSADDLFRLSTMGFRGEALASVAAVSRLQLTTRTEGAVAAYRIATEAGQKTQPSREVGAPVGTQIEIRDLFYNVPARLKFMKSEATETGHISETLVRLSLAYPGVHVRLRAFEKGKDRERTLLELPPHRSPLERSQAALQSRGKGQGVSTLYLCEAHSPGISVSAHIGAPDEATTTGRNLLLLVNRRFVRDRNLLQAIVTGYGELLDKGRYPMCVLHLQLDLALVDVNVHPQKLEVRFANAEAVFETVRRAIAQTCVKAPWLLGQTPAQETERRYVLGTGLSAQEPRPTYSTGSASFPASADRTFSPQRTPEAFRAPSVPASGSPLAERGSGLAEHRQRLQQALKLCAPHTSEEAALHLAPGLAHDPMATLDEARLLLEKLPYVGQLFATYLLCEHAVGNSRELVVIDQHAAHERVLFEKLRRAHTQSALTSQRLLFPVHVELDEARFALVSDNAALLQSLGFDQKPFAEKTVALVAVPDLPKYGRGGTSGPDPEVLFRVVLDELEEHGRTETLEKRGELLLATMACHAATRAGDVLTEPKVRALLAALDDVSLSPYCPHGRPVLFRLSEAELERRFHRT